MKYKVITTNQGKVVTDTTIVTDNNVWVVNDYDFDEPIIFKTNEDFFHTGLEAVKILYSINFSIDKDIPMIIVEDEVEKNFQLQVNETYGGKDSQFFRVDTAREWHKKGYKARGGYSEEDIIKAFNEGQALNFRGRLTQGKEYIQSIKQEYIELEMDLYCELKDCIEQNPNCVLPNNGVCKAREVIKTTRDKNGQLIAYEKLTV